MKSETDSKRSAMWKYVAAPWGRIMREPAFLICLIVLGVCALGLRVGAEKMKWHFRKLPLPLRQSLKKLDVGRFGSYEVIHKYDIPKEIEDELGTTEYIQWTLRDTSLQSNEPGSTVNLFITYYTGNPGLVPHTPDWCYVGSGGLKTFSKNTTIRVPNLDGNSQNDSDHDLLPVRVLGFDIRQTVGVEARTVIYFFVVNGDFVCTRNEVRLRQTRLTDHYAYFSKVEMSFSKPKKLGREGVLAAAQKLTSGLLPVLVGEYWPDWNNLPSSN